MWALVVASGISLPKLKNEMEQTVLSTSVTSSQFKFPLHDAVGVVDIRGTGGEAGEGDGKEGGLWVGEREVGI